MTYAQLIAYIDGLYADGSLSDQDYQKIINYIISGGNLENAPRDLIQIRRGELADLPTLALAELALTTDTGDIYVGGLNGNINTNKSNITLPETFGAKGDGSTDDTLAMNNAIASSVTEKRVLVLTGDYRIEDTLTFISGLQIKGFNASITASATFPENKAMVTGTSLENVNVEGVSFDGNNAVRTTAEMMSFGRPKNMHFKNCVFKNMSYIGVLMAGAENVSFVNCETFNCGKPNVTQEGGASIQFMATLDNIYQSKGILIDGCHLHNNNWSGIYFIVQDGVIRNTRVENNKESGIFGYVNAGLKGSLLVDGCYVHGARKKNISASGIELGGDGVKIVNCHVFDNGSDGISLTNTSDTIVSNNVIRDNGEESASFPHAAGVGIASISGAAGDPYPKRVRIENNIMYGNIYGLITGGDNDVPDGLEILNNDMRGNDLGAIFEFSPGYLGINGRVKGNKGHKSFKPVVGTAVVSGVGSLTVAGVNFSPKIIDLEIVLPSGAQMYRSRTLIDTETPLISCVQGSVDSAARTGTIGGSILLRDGAGAILFQATLASVNSDGFVLNVTTATVNPQIAFIAYP